MVMVMVMVVMVIVVVVQPLLLVHLSVSVAIPRRTSDWENMTPASDMVWENPAMSRRGMRPWMEWKGTSKGLHDW